MVITKQTKVIAEPGKQELFIAREFDHPGELVEVFKTNVELINEANIIVEKLVEHFPEHKINFDLSDCDRILRVQGNNISEEKIIDIVASLNYECEILE